MKTFVCSILLILSGCAFAEPPYHLMTGSGETYTGKAVVHGTNAYYVGDVVNGKPHGEGVMVQNNGDVTYGGWKEGVFSGVGAIISQGPVPSLTAGKVDGGTVSGDGIMIVAGESFVGPFDALGLPHGDGVCVKMGVKKECSYDRGVKVE